jgi:acyl-CoA synthetase (AMP-forming)/AMP-acid ligase II
MMDSSEATPNVGSRLTNQAILSPDRIAIATPKGSHRQGTSRTYSTLRMHDLDERSTCIAAGLQAMGIGPGKRIGLLVRFGEDFIALVFAVLKSGATLVLVDPGMGRKNLIQCLAEARPDGFIAIPLAHAILKCFSSRFPTAKLNVTVGKRWLGMPSPTLSQLEATSKHQWQQTVTSLDQPAAVIFTTGSTGPPKGVLYTHRTFQMQIDQIASHYRISPGGNDLSCFPLFGLFNAVMGTTTILPDMDPTRPADVDPVRLLDAIDQWQINQSFGSPALWTKVGRYCQQRQRTAPSLRLILSAGAPVPPRVLEQMRSAMHPEGCMYTPYGATEALPIASIESRTVLEETAPRTREGAGTCVGNRFSGIRWRVIEIHDGPLHDISETRPLSNGNIGELMVAGDVVSRAYVTRVDQNALHKVADGDRIWHRMGDVGYLDDQDRFWFCGRKSHRVVTPGRTLHTEMVEAIANTHPEIYRSALVGTGISPNQIPLLIVEPWPGHRSAKQQLEQAVVGLLASHTVSQSVKQVAIYPKKLPTDIRHNSKIFREKLTVWANQQKHRDQS